MGEVLPLMSTLPPGASGAPNQQGPEGERPRWAAPAVPPPWAGQPAAPAPDAPQPPPAWTQAPQPPAGWAGQPPQGWPAQPVAPARPSFDRQKWLPTVAAAAIIAGVVLGGIGLDKVVAAPSLGTLDLGSGATMQAAPGWVKVDTGSTDSSITLQKGNVRFVVIAQPFAGQAMDIVTQTEKELQGELDQVQFGEIHEATWGGKDTAMVAFEAIVSGSGSSGGGTLDGEAIGMVAGSDGVQMLAVAPIGMLEGAVTDIKTMAASVEAQR